MIVVRVLVGASILLSLWFVISLGNPRRSENPAVAWLLAAWGWVTVAFETMLFVALFSVRVPVWLAAVVLAAQDGVFAWRILLLRRARRGDEVKVE